MLAWPVLLEQTLAFFVSLTDTYLSGWLSPAATSAVGLGAYVSWLMSMLMGLLGIGMTALVARHWGAGEHTRANIVLNRCLPAAALLGALLTLLVTVGAPAIASLLNMQGETAAVTVQYLRLDAVAHTVSSVSFLCFAALRGAGDMRTPMFVLGCVNIVNMVISASLVFGLGPWPAVGITQQFLPAWGVEGIVVGTVAARLLGGVLILVLLARGRLSLRLQWRECRLYDEAVRKVLRIGGPAAAEGLLMWSGHFAFLMVISALGDGTSHSATFAAHFVGIRVESITYLPAVAWGAAAATLVGQSLGAKQTETAIAAGHTAARQCAYFAVVMTIVFFAGAPQIYRLMHQSPEVHAIGVPAFRLIALFQVPLVFSIVYVHALRGAGETFTPLVITLIGVYGVRLPLSYFFGVMQGGGLTGAWIGMAADVTLRAFCAWSLYRRAGWVHRVL